MIGNPGPDERRAFLRNHFGAFFDDRLVQWTAGFSMAQVREVWISASLALVESKGAVPTLDVALQAVRRLRGQRDLKNRDWKDAGPVGFAVAPELALRSLREGR